MKNNRSQIKTFLGVVLAMACIFAFDLISLPPTSEPHPQFIPVVELIDHKAEAAKAKKEANTIRDVFLAAGERELLGHNTYLDAIGIKLVYDNCKGRKIKSYITHVGGDRTLEEIGYFDNIRLVNHKLIGDFHFFEIEIEYDNYRVEKLREMVKVMPEEFGLSLVVHGLAVFILKTGEELTYEDAKQIDPALFKYKMPVLRPVNIVSFDWVSSGALTPEGVFLPKKDPNKFNIDLDFKFTFPQGY